jgi:phage gpG-like protein
MSEGFEGFEQVVRRIHQLATDVRHVERPLNAAGEYVVGSIKRNFFAEGRPRKWTPLAPSTLRGRRKGKGRGGAKILTDMGHLRDSITKSVSTDGVKIGTNAVQAARQHYGYGGGVGAFSGKTAQGKAIGGRTFGGGRGHSPTPARPFMMLQPEDIEKIGKIFGGYIAHK